MKKIRKFFNLYVSPHKKLTRQLRGLLGFTPANLSVFRLAFKHSSRSSDAYTSNERLEYLGDAILDSVISDYLFKKYPKRGEGFLTEMRSKIVSREHLNELGKDLDLLDLLESKMSKVNFGENIHGNVFEALVGAIFLDKGYQACEHFIYDSVIGPYVDIERLEGKVISYKSLLIEWCQKEKKTFKYLVYDDTGNDETKHFAVKLRIEDRVIAKARATSKKKAEEKASKRAFFALQHKIEGNND